MTGAPSIMELTIEQRKRVLQLYAACLRVADTERAAWIGNLAGPDAVLRESLRELLSDRSDNTVLNPGLAQTVFPSPGFGQMGAGATVLPTVGMILDERFELLEQLGEGGMGRVFKARDRLQDESNAYVAVKVIKENLKQFPGADAALRRETNRTRLLAHPNVITVREFNIDSDYGFAYMTMEYLRGRTLNALLSEQGKAGLTFDRAWQIIEPMGKALANGHACQWEDERGLHTGIVHLDLKPANVFICQDGRIKVLDFGISRQMRSANCSGYTTVIARGLQILTPAYASLEMWNGEAADPRDDIYAYGCIVYELLTGRHPFDGASAPVALQNKDKPKRPEQLDRRQWRALRTALALHRADRTPTVTRFLRDFAPRSWFQKYAAPLIAAPALVLLGAIALGYWRMSLESVDLDEPAPAHVTLSAEEQSTVNDLVARARDRFSDVDITVNPEQLSYVLSDGLDSVSELIGDALRIQPDNREARELRSQMAALYAAKARELLEQHRPPQATFKLIEKGLEIKPIDPGLRKLRRDLCERDTAVCLNGRA